MASGGGSVEGWVKRDRRIIDDYYGQSGFDRTKDLLRIARQGAERIGAPTPCGSDSQCASGFVCVGGECVSSNSSSTNTECPTYTPSDSCDNCDPGCENGIPFVGAGGVMQCGPIDCGPNVGCGIGHICVNGKCQPQQCGAGFPDCDTGYYCCGGECRSLPRPTENLCESSSDCCNGEKCVNYECVDKEPECSKYCQDYYLLTGEYDTEANCSENNTCGPCGYCNALEQCADAGATVTSCECHTDRLAPCEYCSEPGPLGVPKLDPQCTICIGVSDYECECGKQIDVTVCTPSGDSKSERNKKLDEKIARQCEEVCANTVSTCRGICENKRYRCADTFADYPNRSCPEGFVCRQTGRIAIADGTVDGDDATAFCLYEICDMSKTPPECARYSIPPEEEEETPRQFRIMSIAGADWGGGRYRPYCPEQGDTFPWEYFGYDGQGQYQYDYRPCAWYCYRFAEPDGIPYLWEWPKPTDTPCLQYFLERPPGWDGGHVTGQPQSFFDIIRGAFQLVGIVDMGLTPRIVNDSYPGGATAFDADCRRFAERVRTWTANGTQVRYGINDTYAEFNWIERLIQPSLEARRGVGRGPFDFEKFGNTAEWLGCQGSGSIADGTFVPATADGGVIPKVGQQWFGNWHRCTEECNSGNPGGASIPVDAPADPGFPVRYTPAGYAQPPTRILAFLNRVIVVEGYTGDLMPAPGGWRYGPAAGDGYELNDELYQHLYNTNDPAGEPDTLKWPPPGVTPEMIITPESVGLVQLSDGSWGYPETEESSESESSGGGY